MAISDHLRKLALRSLTALDRLPILRSWVELSKSANELRKLTLEPRKSLEHWGQHSAALRQENEALRSQLASVGLELSDARARLEDRDHNSAALGKENEALRSQLASVGLELSDARARLAGLQERDERKKSASAMRYRDGLILLPRLLQLLSPDEQFLIVDGGAREVDRDPRWRPFPPDRLRFIGFEPDEAEAARLNATRGPGGLEWQFIPAGLWGMSGRMRLEHNKATGGSSFLTQNRELTDRWKFENPTETTLARDAFFPVSCEDCRVVSLADWAKDANVNAIDFIKLNVQGGELQILQGAGRLLERVLGLLVEVSFVESYKRRPMFADIDRYLEDRGFVFFDLLAHHYVGRATAPIAARHLIVSESKLGQLVSSWGQLIEGHALFFRDPMDKRSGRRFEPSLVVKLAAFAEVFGQIEYAFELIAWLAGRNDVVATPFAAQLHDVIAEGSAEYRKLV
jgi:FkbM family methyltransferase